MWLLGNNLNRVFHPLLLKTFSCFLAPRGTVCCHVHAPVCVTWVWTCVWSQRRASGVPVHHSAIFLSWDRVSHRTCFFVCLFVFSLDLGWLSSNMLSPSVQYWSCKLSQSFQASSGCWRFEFRSQLQQVLITTGHFAVFLKSFSNRCSLTPLQ